MPRFLPYIIICCLLPVLGSSQFCSGSLGPDIIHQDFGHNRYSLPAGKTTFTPGQGCPSKGNYVISNFLFGCGDRTWVQMTGDHYYPGNVGGNYMLVNAAATPGTVYTDTIQNLCGNTRYQFAAWVTNVMQTITCGSNPPLANLTFAVQTIAGTELVSANTGLLALTQEKQWKQFGVAFTTPANESTVIISIKTSPNPTDACKFGSSFALDDITLNQCGPEVKATLDGSNADTKVCANYTNPFILKGVYGPGYAKPAVKWQTSTDSGRTWADVPGATAATYAIPRRTVGQYWYRMIVAEAANINSPFCGTASNEIYIEVHEVPLPNPAQSLLGCTGKNYNLPKPDDRSLSVRWTGPNNYVSASTSAFIPNLQTRDTGLYISTQNFHYGCVSVDSFYLNIFPGTNLTVKPVNGICEGQSVQLVTSSPDAIRFSWTPGKGLSDSTIASPLAKPTDSTTYKIVIVNKYGCKDSAQVDLPVYRNITANAGVDKVMLAGDTATLSATVKGTAVNFFWTPNSFMSSPQEEKPLVFPPTDAVYTLHAVSSVGCGSITDDVQVKVYNDLYIPNSFTPNGDGKNDVFKVPYYDNYIPENIEIYNRWGKLVFHSTGAYATWDGRVNGEPQQTGTYTYRVVLHTRSGKKITRSGTILLLR